MLIPHRQLPAETLRALIEEFVSREGTEYGEYDVALSAKVDQVLKQIVAGEVLITWDEVTQSAGLIGRHDYRAEQ